MSAPWLSVLIPVFNVEDYLRECVESVASQLDDGVEVILVDDCSTDGSADLLQQLQREWAGRFRLLRHEHNQGLSAARNTMLDVAQGRYIWFLDSDDVLLPQAVAELKRVVERHDPDLVLCDFRVWRTPTTLKHKLRGELHRRTFSGPSDVLLSDSALLLSGLFDEGHLHIWSKISKRSLWSDGLRFPVGKYFEDMATTPRLALRARSYYHAPRVWVAYRQRSGSILASKSSGKMRDLSSAMLGYRDELSARIKNADVGARFSMAYCCARNFICVARQLDEHDAADKDDLMMEYQRNFLASLPLSLRATRMQYVRRGWLWRLARLNFWLWRADRTSRRHRSASTV